MAKKIACIGSAPSSVRLAPYRDPTWQIWGCSPGAYPIVERADAWFELHRWEPPVVGCAELQVPWFSPEYCQWLGLFKGPVYMIEHIADVQNSVAYPMRRMLDKYGPFFFNSSLSYMMALALEDPELEEIGLWGVDMSATEEYGYQRAGCHFFVTEALRRGIKVHVPPESDLLQPKPLYGLNEATPMMVKLTARRRELTNRLGSAQGRADQAQREILFLQGALDDLNYMIETWVSNDLLESMAKPQKAYIEPPALSVVVK
jgi:hypothetical protein